MPQATGSEPDAAERYGASVIVNPHRKRAALPLSRPKFVKTSTSMLTGRWTDGT